MSEIIKNEIVEEQDIPETENYSEYEAQETDAESNLPIPADNPEEDSLSVLGTLFIGLGIAGAVGAGYECVKHKDQLIRTGKAWFSPNKETRQKLKKEIKQEKAWKKAVKAGIDPATFTDMCIKAENAKPDPEPVQEETSDKKESKKK